MIGFFIKKAFFDSWDNLIGTVCYNLIGLSLVLLFLLSTYLINISGLLFFITSILLLFIFAVVSGGLSHVGYNYAEYKTSPFKSFIEGVKRNFTHSAVYFLLLSIIFVIYLIAIPFYMEYKIVGVIISLVLFWVSVLIILALPFYFPLTEYLPGDGAFKTIKKCFLIMGDNMLFTLFFFIYNLFLIVISILTMGIIPGFTGLNSASCAGIKLIMLKYDYIEQNPDVDRKHLPWSDILFDEKEKVGPRSLKSMIFPWK